MRVFWITAFLTVAADQFSKWLVVHALDLRNILFIEVLPPFLNFHMAWNRGINFGLLAGENAKWALIALALAISAFVIFWIRSEPGRPARIAAGLLVGGAIGNVLDRVIYGAVADFLNVSCCGIDNPFAFNLADVAIFAGALGLVFFTGRKPGA